MFPADTAQQHAENSVQQHLSYMEKVAMDHAASKLRPVSIIY